MTAYAPPPVAPPPPELAAPPRQPWSQPGSRKALIASWGAVIVCGGAAVTSAIALTTPGGRPVHTVIVSPTLTREQVAAAEKRTCDAWQLTSTRMAEAGNAVASAPHGWDDARKREAIAAEARTTLVETAYLQTQMGPATPREITVPVHDYLVASFDMENATMHEKGYARNDAIDRVNAATNKVNAACGMS
ncbi:MAG: hypothetical protein ACLP9Y_18980 [Mycobacterium sp.]